jgi:hypothetical protein
MSRIVNYLSGGGPCVGCCDGCGDGDFCDGGGVVGFGALGDLPIPASFTKPSFIGFLSLISFSFYLFSFTRKRYFSFL